MKKKIIIQFFCMLYFVNFIWAQNCDLPRVAAEFSMLSNVFCEGQVHSIENTTIENGHTNMRYIMDWGDGVKDTVMQKKTMTHTYILKDQNPCSIGKVEMELRLRAIPLDCPDKTHNIIKPVYVTFKPRPKFDANGEICIGSALAITNQTCPTSGVKFLWDFGDPNSGKNTDTLKNPGHTFSAPGTYSVSLTTTNTCGPERTSKTIRVVGLPKADFTYNPTSACLPAPIIALKNNSNQWSNTRWEITPNDTLKWRFIDTLMNPGTRNISIRANQSGEYTVKLIATNACANPDIKTEIIKILAPPQVEITSPGSFCDSKSIRLSDLQLKTQGDITAYHWTFVNGEPSSSTQRDFGTVNFTKSGSIIIRVESPCGPKADTVPITIGSTVPVSLAGNRTSFCRSEASVQLKATPEGGQWSIRGGGSVAFDAKGVLNPALLSTGKYTLMYSAGVAQCPNEKELEIEVKELPQVKLQTESPACGKLSYVPKITYQGEINQYKWTFNQGNPASALVSDPGAIQFTTPGTKKVRIEVTGTCGKALDSISIQINEIPKASASSNSPIPPNETLRLEASSDQSNVQYLWSGPNNFSSTEKSPQIKSVSQINAGTYSVKVSNAQSCVSQSTTQVVVQSSGVKVSPRSAVICQGDSIALSGFGASLYLWEPRAGLNRSNQAFVKASPAQTTTYTLTRVDAQGKNDTVKVTVYVNPKPSVNAGEDLEICPPVNPVTLKSQPIGGQWSGDDQVSREGVFIPTRFGETRLSYTYTDPKTGCSNQDMARIDVVEAAELSLPADQTVCESLNPINLLAEPSGGTWQNKDNLVSPAGDFMPNLPGTHYLRYRYGTGSCLREDSIRIVVGALSTVNDLEIFPAFSPNGDGVNETFVIRAKVTECCPSGILTICYPRNELIVFNRWNELVLRQVAYQNDWKAKDLPGGAYFYLFYPDKENREVAVKGAMTVLK